MWIIFVEKFLSCLPDIIGKRSPKKEKEKQLKKSVPEEKRSFACSTVWAVWKLYKKTTDEKSCLPATLSCGWGTRFLVLCSQASRANQTKSNCHSERWLLEPHQLFVSWAQSWKRHGIVESLLIIKQCTELITIT